MSDCTADRHGTVLAYKDGCRCPEARYARSRYLKEWQEDRGRVSHVGAVRRLQALSAIGWSPRELADEIGSSRQYVNALRNGAHEVSSRSLYDRITAVYERLSGTPGGSGAARMHAESKGWAPPLAWDDDALDNPAAEPTGVGPPARSGVHLDEVRWLESFGESRELIAARLGVAPGSLERAESRARQAMRNQPAEWTPAHEMGDAHALAR